MTQVISFEDYTPAPRYDGTAWTQVRIDEGTSSAGTWTPIGTVALTPVDTNPANPQTRSFTTHTASAAPDLWYQLVFSDAAGNTQQPTYPVQNATARTSYATVAELAQLLQVNPTERQAALQRVLDAAAAEIDEELGRHSPFPPAVVVEVNLERAVEHWRQMQSPFGLIGLPGEIAQPAFAAADSWNRHAQKLAPLKKSWGFA